MLTIVIEGDELWDEVNEVFTYGDSTVLRFEHSLVSLSKWEAKFHKRFLSPEPKTEDEMFGYIECMLITPDVPPNLLDRLSVENCRLIDEYINDPMTGSTVNQLHQDGPRSSEQISSELIYFWMSQYQIDKDCETWHLNRLFTLIKIHHAKTQKPKKMSKTSRAQQMAEINAARKARMGTSG